ncbi:hypothetical protein [Tolypothrix sp. VBCCA 56010]|uniref:hypothetical protein n=1 Tax=Tolypothrix sp. VBCCA 56010 TaxID=3137731 RepID=UPI003D7D68CC
MGNGHRAWGMERIVLEPAKSKSRFFNSHCPMPIAHCPMPNSQFPISNYPQMQTSLQQSSLLAE